MDIDRDGARNLFHALIENSSDAVALVDADGRVRFASASSARVLGYEVEERIGRSAFELVHPDDVAATREAFLRSVAEPGVPITIVQRVRHKDGGWRWIEVTGVNRIGEPAVGGIVLNYRDVTERQRTADALRASEERLRHLVEHAQDLIYYCDMDGRFTYVNQTAARVMQYGEHELVGRHYLSLVREDERERVGLAYKAQVVQRLPTTYSEFPAVARDGRTIWVGQHVQLVYEDGVVVGIQAIARDISRQKDAEERLRRSEARYRSLIQDAAYGIYRSSEDGAILDANPALAQLLGCASVDELMDRNMAEFYRSPAERAELIARYRVERFASAEVNWRRKDGAAIVVRLSVRTVTFEDGSICFEGIAEDITARRALEEQLRQAQKMEAVGRLARGIAHDFNNVLAAIMGCSDLLVARLERGSPSRLDAEEIQKAAERGAALTRQLMAFSRRQALQPAVLNLHAVVAGFEQMCRRLIGPGLDFELRLVGEPPMVRLEPGQLEQVLLNLVVNARDAMPDGGALHVRADTIALEAGDAITYAGLPPGRYARLSVRDTGTGIAPELRRHVFEPFFTTKDASKGTGLGLSIVYGIAKEAGGTVTFASGPERGTTFEVVLPLALSPEP